MTLNELEETLLNAKADGMDIAVEVTVPGQEGTELIINRNANIDNKLAYYKNAYSDYEDKDGVVELTLNNNKEIKIVGVSMMNFF